MHHKLRFFETNDNEVPGFMRWANLAGSEAKGALPYFNNVAICFNEKI